MRFHSFLKTALLSSILLAPVLSFSQLSSARSVDYVIERYVEQMGGRAALAQIKSIRMSGTITYKDGQKHNLTVLKKKPNKTRIMVDTGLNRVIQAYDGKVAWFARLAGADADYVKMQGDLEKIFIRQAPLENILFYYKTSDAELSLGADVQVSTYVCHQIIAEFPDGRKNIFFIEKDTYTERRILDYDTEGNLISELVPKNFENFEGVLFSMQILRIENGSTLSTLDFDSVDINVGILDTAFAPPESLMEMN